jgi:4-amino-4-deoxy-L-arabinose transferase-like glycosyltransferase
MVGRARRTLRTERFWQWLLGIAALGLAIRLSYVFGFHRHDQVWGDPFMYHYGANLLAQGKPFIHPLAYVMDNHREVPAADHPPLYILWLAVPSLIGLNTVLIHMLWSSLLGTGTVVMTGLLGRRVAGDRAGLIAATIAALYPNIWVYDGQVLSETMAIFIATLTLLLAYRALDEPTIRRVVAVGVACGLAALARSELILLVPALMVPLCFRTPSWRDRAVWAMAGISATLLVLAPWVIFNIARFDHPVYLSSQLDATLAGANCNDTYHGPTLGLVSSTCMPGDLDPHADQSTQAIELRRRFREFVGDNTSRLPAVVAARLGRVLGLYHPRAQIEVDNVLEGREHRVAWAGMISAYVLELGAIAGAIQLHRRRRVVYPLLVLPAIVLFTVALTYGTNRFRASGETSIVVLAAVAIDALSQIVL